MTYISSLVTLIIWFAIALMLTLAISAYIIIGIIKVILMYKKDKDKNKHL